MANTPTGVSRQYQQRVEDLQHMEFVEIKSSRRFWTGFWGSYREIWDWRSLLWQLTRREVRSRYKGTRLGIVWSLARPITQLLVFYFIIGEVLGAARAIPSFAVYVFVGLTLWGLFADILNSSAGSILANAGIVKKIYLPREIFPLSAIASALLNFAIQFVILLAATYLFATGPIWQYVPGALLGLLLLLTFATALALIISITNAYAKDVQYLVEVGLGLLFWASPVVYSIQLVSSRVGGTIIESIYFANPVTLSMLAFQRAFWGAPGFDNAQWFPPNLELRMAIALVAVFVLLLVSQKIFSRLQRDVAQEL